MTRLLSALGQTETALRVVGAALFAFVFVRALRTAEMRALRSPGWLLTRVGVTAAAGVVLIAALNYLVNPLGIYAPRIFEPIVLHSRTEKMRSYRAAQPPPEIVVLGSSSSFTMSPAYIRERTGRTAFNASLHGGVPEDYLAFLRYMESLRKLPKILVVPMSVEQLRPDLPSSFEPHNPLQPYLEREPGSVLADLRRLMTLDQTRASLRLLAAEMWGRPPPHYRFEPDGSTHFVDSGASLDAIVDSYLATKEWGAGLYKFQELDETQRVYFRRFLELARDLGVKVIVYVPPLHPRAIAFYEQETNLPALRTKLLEQLRAWNTGGLVAGLHDFSRVESFGGNASQFHDLAHPTAEASRRMLDIIFPPRPASS